MLACDRVGASPRWRYSSRPEDLDVAVRCSPTSVAAVLRVDVGTRSAIALGRLPARATRLGGSARTRGGAAARDRAGVAAAADGAALHRAAATAIERPAGVERPSVVGSRCSAGSSSHTHLHRGPRTARSATSPARPSLSPSPDPDRHGHRGAAVGAGDERRPLVGDARQRGAGLAAVVDDPMPRRAPPARRRRRRRRPRAPIVVPSSSRRRAWARHRGAPRSAPAAATEPAPPPQAASRPLERLGSAARAPSTAIGRHPTTARRRPASVCGSADASSPRRSIMQFR